MDLAHESINFYRLAGFSLLMLRSGIGSQNGCMLLKEYSVILKQWCILVVRLADVMGAVLRVGGCGRSAKTASCEGKTF